MEDRWLDWRFCRKLGRLPAGREVVVIRGGGGMAMVSKLGSDALFSDEASSNLLKSGAFTVEALDTGR
jgi:hypothetical protein